MLLSKNPRSIIYNIHNTYVFLICFPFVILHDDKYVKAKIFKHSVSVLNMYM